MNCEEARGQLPDFLAGKAHGAIEEHVANCAACGQLAQIWARMGALEDEQPSPALRARFEAMLDAYSVGAEHSARRFSFSAWMESWWPKRPAWQFAVAAACLVIGVAVGRYATRGGGSEEMAKLREEVHNTRQLVAVSLLQQQSASDRLRGVTWSSRMAQPDSEVLGALLKAVRYDSSVDVRLAAVDALGRYAGDPTVRTGLIDALGGQQSPLVQIALIDLMVEARERGAVSALERLKQDKNANAEVRERAEWGLQHF